MFQSLQRMPPDSIVSLIAAFQQDSRVEKIDLGIGVYQDEAGNTPVMAAVKEAERRLLETQQSKSYQGIAGDADFNRRLARLVFGEAVLQSVNGRMFWMQSTGGSGALRIAAEVARRAGTGAQAWVGAPTWANHIPLIGGAGLAVKEYPYFDAAGGGVDFAAMAETLSRVPAGDLVVLHGCCHNPTGADLSPGQWREVVALAGKQGFIPLVDLAYQGLGDGLKGDACGARLVVEQLPEAIVAVSCSKNFGIYRERAGAVFFLAQQAQQVEALASQAMTSARRMYSMPPAHGAAIVATILEDEALTAQWWGELAEARNRLRSMRRLLVEQLAARGAGKDYSFIARQKGMFSFLGVTPEQVAQLQRDAGIYMLASGRINLAGINPGNIGYLADAVAALD